MSKYQLEKNYTMLELLMETIFFIKLLSLIQEIYPLTFRAY